jgi:hydroxylamine oxidation protein HaoB
LIPADATPRTTNVTGGDKLLPSLGILLVTGGLVLLGWFAYLWFTPAPAPYQYQLLESETVDHAELELDAWPELTLSKYQVKAADIDKPIAHAILARRGDELPVLINWESHTSELFLAADRKPEEITGLADAINKHAAPDARILAWWDTAQQLKLLTGRDTLFNGHLNEPLIIPDQWQDQREAILAYENQFWQAKVSQQQRDQFQRFSEALVSLPEQGLAMLRQMTDNAEEAYLIVHVTDLYKLALMQPDKFGVTYQNFPMTGNMHGLINHMKVLLDQNEFDTYTLQSLSDQAIRVFFLDDEKSSETLMAQLFPFVEKTAPTELQLMQLIYQHGGYWVFQIPLQTAKE